jgi:hypothetical protein
MPCERPLEEGDPFVLARSGVHRQKAGSHVKRRRGSVVAQRVESEGSRSRAGSHRPFVLVDT